MQRRHAAEAREDKGCDGHAAAVGHEGTLGRRRRRFSFAVGVLLLFEGHADAAVAVAVVDLEVKVSVLALGWDEAGGHFRGAPREERRNPWRGNESEEARIVVAQHGIRPEPSFGAVVHPLHLLHQHGGWTVGELIEEHRARKTRERHIPHLLHDQQRLGHGIATLRDHSIRRSSVDLDAVVHQLGLVHLLTGQDSVSGNAVVEPQRVLHNARRRGDGARRGIAVGVEAGVAHGPLHVALKGLHGAGRVIVAVAKGDGTVEGLAGLSVGLRAPAIRPAAAGHSVAIGHVSHLEDEVRVALQHVQALGGQELVAQVDAVAHEQYHAHAILLHQQKMTLGLPRRTGRDGRDAQVAAQGDVGDGFLQVKLHERGHHGKYHVAHVDGSHVCPSQMTRQPEGRRVVIVGIPVHAEEGQQRVFRIIADAGQIPVGGRIGHGTRAGIAGRPDDAVDLPVQAEVHHAGQAACHGALRVRPYPLEIRAGQQIGPPIDLLHRQQDGRRNDLADVDHAGLPRDQNSQLELRRLTRRPRQKQTTDKQRRRQDVSRHPHHA
eukprot:scaffold2248_cov261-Pinguiococcus_pyrenoidosus.AAC.2